MVLKTYLALSLIFLQIFNTIEAQSLPGITDSVYSQILKEKRFVQVLLPENYKPGTGEKYDVIYLLDGSENIKLLSQIQQFAQDESYISTSIIVGISNTDPTGILLLHQ
jgi:predicted alpha/beta superfamily hydrolase